MKKIKPTPISKGKDVNQIAHGIMQRVTGESKASKRAKGLKKRPE